MADVVIAVTQTVCPTTQGTQDITTTALGGRTPKAALFIVTLGTVNGTAATHASMSVGGTDGTQHYSGSFFSTSGVTSSATSSVQTTNSVARIMETSSAYASGFFNQWLTNGVRLTWGVEGSPPLNVPAAAYLVTTIFFAGDDLSAYCGNSTITTTVNTATDITAVGFEPDAVFTANGMTNGLGLGVTHNNGAGTVTSGASYLRSRNGRNTSEVYGMSRRTLSGNPVGAVQCASAFNADNSSWTQLSAFDASGFTVTPRNAASPSSTFTFLALKFGGRASKVWSYTTPATTGNADDTGPGFEPSFVWYTETTHPALDTYYTDSNANGLGIAAITAAAQYANCIVDEDAVGTMSTASMAANTAAHVRSTVATQLIGAAWDSFLSTGVRSNYNPTAARHFLGFALEKESVQGESLVALRGESLDLSESVAVLRGLTRLRSDTLELTETLLRVMAHRRMASESLELSELTQRVMALRRQLSENLDLQESLHKSLFMPRLRSEGLDLSESLYALRGLLQIHSEVVDLAEGVLRYLGLARIRSEALDLGESFLRTRELTRLLSEGLGPGETTLRSMALARFRSEGLDLGETLFSLQSLVRLQSEVVDTVEGVLHYVIVAGLNLLGLRSEGLDLGETRFRFMALARLRSESLDLDETRFRLMALRRILSEEVSGTESFLRRLGLVRLQSEVVDAVEGLLYYLAGAGLALVALRSEALDLGESFLRALGLARLRSEDAETHEGLLRFMNLVRLLEDQATLVEDRRRLMGLRRILSEDETTTESLLRAMFLRRQRSETQEVDETRNGLRGILRLVDETVQVVWTAWSYVREAPKYSLLLAEVVVQPVLTSLVDTWATLRSRLVSRSSLEGKIDTKEEP